MQAHLLALHLARVAGDQPGFAEDRLQRRIEFDERAGQAVTYRARLAELSAPGDVDFYVEAREIVGQRQRLALRDQLAGTSHS